MKRFHFCLIILTLTLLSSCGNQSNNDYADQTDFVQQYDPSGQTEVNHNNQAQDLNNNSNQKNYTSGKMKPIGVVDQKTGIEMWSGNLPSSWSFDYKLDYSRSKEFPATDWTAKNSKAGVSAKNIRSKVYMYSTNPSMVQYFQQAQYAVAAPQSAQAIQQNSVDAMMQQNGYQKINEGPANHHVQRIQRSAQAYNFTGIQVNAITANWEATDGRQAQTTLMHMLKPDQSESTWWYETVVVEGKGKQFTKAAKEFDDGLVAVKDNPKWIQYTHQVIAQQNAVAQQNFNANQQRINNNQRNFEASQRAIVESNNAVNQSIMDGYNTQQQSSDYSHQQFTDYIRDEQNVYDQSGNAYKVESGYNQYYVNDNGEYIGTNDYNYNPNQDQQINNQNWNGTEPYY